MSSEAAQQKLREALVDVRGPTLVQRIRRWGLMVALIGLGLLAGLGYARWAPPVYTAKAHVVVVAQNPGESASAVSYAQAYARIAVQGEALDAAVRANGGALSSSALRRQVRVSSSPDAPVIEVTGSASSARKAVDLANVVAHSLVSTAGRHSGDTRMKLAILSVAIPPAEPASPQPKLSMAVGAATGFLLGGLALLAGVGGARKVPRPARPTPARPAEPGDRAMAAALSRSIGRAPVTINNAANAPSLRSDGSNHTSHQPGDDEGVHHDHTTHRSDSPQQQPVR